MDQNLLAFAAISTIISVCLLLKRKTDTKRRKKRVWVKPWVQKRNSKGIQANLLKELESEDMPYYIKYMRMDKETFDFIASKVAPYIMKQNTHLRNAISVQDRLMVTLRFLATGENYSSLQFSTRIPQCTLSSIIPETCDAIFQSMKDELLNVTTTEEEWQHVANEFESKWQVCNCIGAIDGKHIRIKCPGNGGSHHFNYKSFNSIVLFALVDAHYKFLYVDVGTNGRIGDSGVYAKSKLRRCLMDRSILKIPNEKNLTNTSISAPYVVLADDAFPLSYNVMKPYPLRNITRDEKIFNYRLSRGRRMVESTFGILASRFRIFLTTIQLCPDKVKKITLAACLLHNILTEKRNIYIFRKKIL